MTSSMTNLAGAGLALKALIRQRPRNRAALGAEPLETQLLARVDDSLRHPNGVLHAPLLGAVLTSALTEFPGLPDAARLKLSLDAISETERAVMLNKPALERGERTGLQGLQAQISSWLKAQASRRETECSEPPAFHPIGPGARLRDVRFEITVDGRPLPCVTQSFVCPPGRISRIPDGRWMYAATLPPITFRCRMGFFSIVPNVNVKVDETRPEEQEVDFTPTYDNRSWGGTTDFRSDIIVTAGNRTYKLEDKVHAGCLDGRTPIRLHDGSEVPIEDLTPGEFVLDPVTGRANEIAVIIRGPESRPLIRLETEGVEVLLTSGHPVLCAGGIRKAADLRQGDSVLQADGAPTLVLATNHVPPREGQYVYNLRFRRPDRQPGWSFMLSGGLITGDYDLQQALALTPEVGAGRSEVHATACRPAEGAFERPAMVPQDGGTNDGSSVAMMVVR
ncbi:MAG: hypothetical protein IT186_00670 [Acidobacteria bacterium]|nr:hypothetical protein [Acidobacteriota bacterium]